MARVMVMDDDVNLALEIASALKGGGHEVVVAHSASEARSELWHWDFDLLITDMIVRRDGRPVPDGGLGLITWVRHTQTTTKQTYRLPIIAVSGEHKTRGMDFLLPTAERIGADMVMEKPLDMSKLLTAIVTLCSTDEVSRSAH